SRRRHTRSTRDWSSDVCSSDLPRLMLRASLWSLLVQLLNVLLVWCAARAVDVPVPLGFCFVLMPLVALLTLAPISVNGMGIREEIGRASCRERVEVAGVVGGVR